MPAMWWADRFWFDVNERRWACRKCFTRPSGDVIEFVQWYDGIGRREAVLQLIGENGRTAGWNAAQGRRRGFAAPVG
jgi:hypothetical protein